MYRIVKVCRFEAAHQLDRAYSAACSDTVHGHSYKVEVSLVSVCLDGDLMVVDLGHIGLFLRAMLEGWDHALILSEKLAKEYRNTPNKKLVVLPASPTAEVMVREIYEALDEEVKKIPNENGLRLERVRVWETETGCAEYQEVG